MESQLTGQLRHGAALLTASALTAAGLVFGGAVFAPTDSAHAADEATVSGASLTWGVKASFRNYIYNFAAFEGKSTLLGTTTQDGDKGVYTWHDGSGTATSDGSAADVTFGAGNGVHFQSHPMDGGYALDMQFTNPHIVVTSVTTAELRLDVTGREFESMTEIGPEYSLDDVAMANLDLSGVTPTEADGALTWADVPATLAESGSDAFGSFYQPGETLDPVTFTLPIEVVEAPDPGDDGTEEGEPGEEQPEEQPEDQPEEQPGDDQPSEEQPEESNDDAPADDSATPPATKPDTGTTNGGSAAKTESKPKITCTVEEVAGTAGTPQLSWGVKASFVSYVEGGIANGAISTSNGASRTGSGFLWGSGSGSISDAGQGTVSFPGAVRFTGHDGVMDTTLSNLRVKATGSNSGTLVADVASKDMDGNNVGGSGISFANLSFSSLSANGGTASVTLTAAGAKAFAGFYSSGQAMDSLTLSFSGARQSGTEQVCYDENGNRVNPDGTPYTGGPSANTGGLVTTSADEPVGGWAVLALGFVLALVVARRVVRVRH